MPTSLPYLLLFCSCWSFLNHADVLQCRIVFITVAGRWISFMANVADVNTPVLINKKLEVVLTLLYKIVFYGG